MAGATFAAVLIQADTVGLGIAAAVAVAAAAAAAVLE